MISTGPFEQILAAEDRRSWEAHLNTTIPMAGTQTHLRTAVGGDPELGSRGSPCRDKAVCSSGFAGQENHHRTSWHGRASTPTMSFRVCLPSNYGDPPCGNQAVNNPTGLIGRAFERTWDIFNPRNPGSMFGFIAGSLEYASMSVRLRSAIVAAGRRLAFVLNLQRDRCVATPRI